MSGEKLIEQFEEGATPAGSFHHADHVRLGFEYLCRFSVVEGIDRFSAALKRFATAHGKSQLYHETITWAYLLLIHERMARSTAPQNWDEFAASNPDLFIWKGGALARLYRPETLDSDLARRVFVLPDRIAAPCLEL